MLGAGYGNISDIEVMLVVISTLGLAFSLYNTWRAYGDYKWLRDHKVKNGRWFLAKMWLWSESGRAYLQFVFAYIGVRAWFYPDPPTTVDGVILRWMFLLASAVVTAKTINIWYTRSRLIETSNGVHITDRMEEADDTKA